jgi:hypothetical protein
VCVVTRKSCETDFGRPGPSSCKDTPRAHRCAAEGDSGCVACKAGDLEACVSVADGRFSARWRNIEFLTPSPAPTDGVFAFYGDIGSAAVALRAL